MDRAVCAATWVSNCEPGSDLELAAGWVAQGRFQSFFVIFAHFCPIASIPIYCYIPILMGSCGVLHAIPGWCGLKACSRNPHESTTWTVLLDTAEHEFSPLCISQFPGSQALKSKTFSSSQPLYDSSLKNHSGITSIFGIIPNIKHSRLLGDFSVAGGSKPHQILVATSLRSEFCTRCHWRCLFSSLVGTTQGRL